MDVKLKERLVGALVIVALAVLVLPVVFDDDKGESALDSRIPDTPAGEPVRVITLSSPRPLDEIQPAAGQIAAGTRNEEVSAGKPVFEAVVPDAGVDGDLAAGEPESANPAPVDALAAAEPVRSPAAASAPDSAATANTANTANTRNVAGATPAKPAASPVGASSAAASDAAIRTEGKGGEPAVASKATVPAANAKVQDQPASKPAATTPVPRLAEAVGGFVVQAGLFSSPEGAKRVEQQLRAAGLKAYLRREKQDGKALTRVLVGPLGSRAEADAVKAKMKAAQVDGMVAAYDPLKH